MGLHLALHQTHVLCFQMSCFRNSELKAPNALSLLTSTTMMLPPAPDAGPHRKEVTSTDSREDRPSSPTPFSCLFPTCLIYCSTSLRSHKGGLVLPSWVPRGPFPLAAHSSPFQGALPPLLTDLPLPRNLLCGFS